MICKYLLGKSWCHALSESKRKRPLLAWLNYDHEVRGGGSDESAQKAQVQRQNTRCRKMHLCVEQLKRKTRKLLRRSSARGKQKPDTSQGLPRFLGFCWCGVTRTSDRHELREVDHVPEKVGGNLQPESELYLISIGLFKNLLAYLWAAKTEIEIILFLWVNFIALGLLL